MKRHLIFLLTVLTSVASCTGTHDPEAEGNGQSYTLTADKTSIESDGMDAVTFTITDSEGNVLTDKEHIREASFQIVETGQWRSVKGGDEHPNVFTSITDGTYTVKAMYDGVYCDNEVSFTSANRSKYELFHKNVLIYRFTATWCGYCPSMTTALANIGENAKDHSIVVELHGNDQYSFDAITEYTTLIYNTKGFPYCVYSLVEESGKRTVNDIQKHISNVCAKYPAQTGIKASVQLSGSALTVKGAVKASVQGTYDLGMAIIKDNCIPSSPSEANESVYNDVLCAITGNYSAMSSDGSFPLAADQEYTFAKEISDASFAVGSKDYQVVLFTLVKKDGRSIIDNAISVGIGESVDYRYN